MSTGQANVAGQANGEEAPAVSAGSARDAVSWHTLAAAEACAQLGVDRVSGLDATEVEQRRAQVGPNRLDEAEKEPGWQAFLRQYRDLMQLVLLGAAIVSMVALQEFSTGLVIIGLTVLNAVLGLNQEGKAAESVAALQKMLIIRAHVRRGGELGRRPGRGARPGDVAVVRGGRQDPGGRSAAGGRDAGDRGVRADGREHARS